MSYYTYILTTKNNKIFYIGVTSELIGRVLQHKQKLNLGFTSKYNVSKLIYFEEYKYIDEAIQREKQLKNWTRKWKAELVEKYNLEYDDLLNKLLDTGSSPV